MRSPLVRVVLIFMKDANYSYATIVSPQQGGIPTVETSGQSNIPTISEAPPITPK